MPRGKTRTLEAMSSLVRPLVAVLTVTALLLFPLSGVAAGDEGKKPGGMVGLKYKEPKEAEFLKAVLKSMKLHYTATATPDGELVEWASRDPAQQMEIQNRVSQFLFISTQCPGMSPPDPSQPARPRLSC